MADVAVVGAGLAGLTAAVAAAEAGARVVICEKQPEIGGSTVLSAGLSAFAGTDEQVADGVADDVEVLRRDLLETGQHRNDPALVDTYCAEQLATYRWLRGMGIVYGEVHAASGQSVPRSHPTDTRVLVRTLLERARELGADFLPGTAARRLLVEDGQVVGIATDGGKLAARAVVLASGGFSRNPELLTRFAPQMERALRGGGAGSTGDGLLMAWKAGAGVTDTPYIKGTFGIHPDPGGAEGGTGILAVYKGAIAVNGSGRRFIDESLPYKVIGDACLAQNGGIAHQIFDARVMALSDAGVPIYDFAARRDNGLLLQADTLEELAKQLDIPADALTATVTQYNTAIEQGTPDHLGRRTLSGRVGTPTPIATAPFYAHPSTAVVLATYCGLTIDPRTRVLDVYGEAIPGLYAAGEITGGLHGAGYVTGTSIGKAAIFGRIAGLSASEEAQSV
ncbi:FAD-dependent oxidoreductase [Streptomyces sp. NPDC002928]|uniref:FAD-dependent oxidoreductase n=1 Tax=Streptomyces sp. NPDC002928 TaxID=3154440 RepID=UPI0033B7BDB4